MNTTTTTEHSTHTETHMTDDTLAYIEQLTEEEKAVQDEEKRKQAALKESIKTPLSGHMAHASLLAYAFLRKRPAHTQTATLDRWFSHHIRILAMTVRDVVGELEGIPRDHKNAEAMAKRLTLLETIDAWLRIPAPAEWAEAREVLRLAYVKTLHARKVEMRRKYEESKHG